MEDPLADIPYISAPPTLQHSIIGPCVAGYQTQVLLCGILLQQVVAYWGELKHHSKLSKYTAVVVVTLNVVYTALCFEDGFTLASSTDRRTDTLYSGTFQSQFLPLCNGMIAAAAETFLTIRAGAFFMNPTAKYAFYVWQSCLVVLVLFGSCATFTVGMVAYFKPDQADVIPYNTVVAIWLWSSAASDCSISIALAYNLHKRIANFNQKTDSILRKLILIGLRTAAFTAILSLVGAVISSVYSGNDPSKVAITVPFWIPTGALYGISLFTTLSSTRRVVGTVRRGQDQPPSSSKPGRARSTSQSGGGMPRHLLNFNHHHPLAKGPLEINVHREVVRDVEIDCSIEKPETAFEASFETIGNRSSQWTSSAA